MNRTKGKRPVLVVADTKNDTFSKVSKLKSEVDIINLSSDFAVKFVLQRERVDMLLFTEKIGDLEGILRLAARKGIKVYKIGKDIPSSFKSSHLDAFLKKELIGDDRGEANTGVLDFFKAFRAKGIRQKDCADTIKRQNENIKKGSNEIKRFPSKTHKKTNNGGKGPKGSFPVTGDIGKIKIKAIKQKSIIFFKAKGGVGSTMLSLFLGYDFRNLKTLLIDMNFNEGGSDLGYYLDIPKTPNMTSFFEDYSYPALSDSILKVKEGFDVLQPPPSYNLYKKIDLQDIYEMVDIAKKKYHVLIFDLPNLLNELTLGVLDIGDVVVMVSDCSLGSMGRLIDIDKKYLSCDLEKVIVLNKHKNNKETKTEKLLSSTIQNISKYHVIDEVKELSDFKSLCRGISDIGTLKAFSSKIFDILTDEKEIPCENVI